MPSNASGAAAESHHADAAGVRLGRDLAGHVEQRQRIVHVPVPGARLPSGPILGPLERERLGAKRGNHEHEIIHGRAQAEAEQQQGVVDIDAVISPVSQDQER
ncbi:MAG: hypothetical protein HYT81_03720 [Gemmatimonadetes bacterium]|nr:hypothetical protein [Gemmatimonadota bacterium]